MEIPFEVFHVKSILWTKQPVGMDMYNHCQEVINKYPEHFPWEHKYKKVPQEVHDAYQKEAYPEKEELESIGIINCGEGLWSAIQKGQEQYEINKEKNKDKTLEQLFQEWEDADNKRINEERLERKRIKTIWDKHYRKYGLEYKD